LCEYLDKLDLEGCNVLELGSGTGVVGLHVVSRGSARKVVLTDHAVEEEEEMPSYSPDGEISFSDTRVTDDSVMRTLYQNAYDNSQLRQPCGLASGVDVSSPATVATSTESVVLQLDWFAPEHTDKVLEKHGPFDYVIGSDLTYMAGSHAALASTLATLHAASSPPDQPLEHTVEGGAEIKSSSIGSGSACGRLFRERGEAPTTVSNSRISLRAPKVLLAHQERLGGEQLKMFQQAIGANGFALEQVHNDGPVSIHRLVAADGSNGDSST
jgi:predicted nicotinamide N-methyase